MSTLSVTKKEFEKIGNEYWSEVFAAAKTMNDEEIGKFKSKLYREKFDDVKIVLEQKPKHSNTQLVELIEKFCDDMSVKNEHCTVYRGSAAIGYGEGIDDCYRPVINEKTLKTLKFTYESEWSDGYRLVYLNEEELVTLTVCEGDLSVTIHDTKEDYEREINECGKFYKEH